MKSCTRCRMLWERSLAEVGPACMTLLTPSKPNSALFDSASTTPRETTASEPFASQANDAGVGGGQREQPEGQAGRGQLDNACVIAQQAGGVACVHVADRAQLFVVAAGEGRTTAHASGSAHDFEIQTARQFDHRFRFVQFGGGEELLARRAETSLRGLQHGAAAFAFPGHVEQSEKETVRANPQKIVKIASGARGKIGDRQVSALERGAFPLHNLWELPPPSSRTQVLKGALS